MRNRAENQITLLMIRHGAVISNKEHRYLGKTDESLMEAGVMELVGYSNAKRYPEVEHLFASPMKRCRETAAILYPGRQPIIIPEWEEMDFGAFEGKNYLELRKDSRYQAWIDSNGMLPFPEGESREEFEFRCEKGFHRMLHRICRMADEKGREPETIGMIVHGGTIMALLSRYYGGEYFDYQVSNGGGYVCRLEGWRAKPVVTGLRGL